MLFFLLICVLPCLQLGQASSYSNQDNADPEDKTLRDLVVGIATQVANVSQKLDVLPQLLNRLEKLETTCQKSDAKEGSPCKTNADCAAREVSMTCSDGSCALRVCDSVLDPDEPKNAWRLVGGSSCNNGYIRTFNTVVGLEFYVCDNDWSEQAAAVACRSLGFSSGGSVRKMAADIDTSSYWGIEHFDCSGSERSLFGCERPRYRNSCPISELAAVTCHS